MYVSGQRKASAAAKLSDICSVISDIECFFYKISKQNHFNFVRNKIMYYYLFFIFIVFLSPALIEYEKYLFRSVPLYASPSISHSASV